MGIYVLYTLMQAFVALIIAYFSATLVFRERKLYMLLVCLGFYLMMGSSLVEIWGDKVGYETWAIGLNAALVATGVAVMGSGALLREVRYMEDDRRVEMMAHVFLGISLVMGTLLALLGGSSDSIVDPQGAIGAEISGAFVHLGPIGWVLGSPLVVGALLMAWMGARTGLTRTDPQGFWLMGAGVLFLIWPFDLLMGQLPLSPAILMMALTVTYFGFQLPKEEGEGQQKAGGVDEVDDDRPAPWVMEAIAAKERDGSSEGDGNADEDAVGDSGPGE
jgi:hypothetical protein